MTKVNLILKEFFGLHTNKDVLDIESTRTPDCANVAVEEDSSINTRPGFSRKNKTAYAGAIVGLYDLISIEPSAIQTTNGYSRYLYSNIVNGYLYFVNPTTSYKLNVGRSLVNQLLPTWRLYPADDRNVSYRSPVIAGTTYTSVVTNTSTPDVNTIRYNIADMTTNALTQRATPAIVYSPSSIFNMPAGTDLYIAYMGMDLGMTTATLYIDTMNAAHGAYANVKTQAHATTCLFSFLNVLPYDATHMYITYFSDTSTLQIGNMTTAGVVSFTTYTGASYTNINSMAFAFVTPNFAGFYLKTTDYISHDLYFCSAAANGTSLSLGATILDSDISFDPLDEQLNVVLHGTTLYVAYCTNSGELRLGSCTTTGTGFSYEVIASDNCHSAQTFVVGDNLYITYSSQDMSGYNVNIYSEELI
jgi:hypothetical protein